MRSFLCVSIAASLILVSPRAFGQEDGSQKSPVQHLLSKGLTSGGKSGSNKEATRFQPAGKRLVLDSFVNGITDDAAERKAFREALENLMAEYEKASKSNGLDNDVTLAVGYAISQYWSIWKGTEVPEKATDALYQQLRGVLETPEMAKTPDADKQRFYEQTLYGVFTFQVMQAAASDPTAKQTVAKSAHDALQSLLGVAPEKVAITTEGLEISGASADVTAKSGATATPASTSAANVTYTAPPNSRMEKMGGTTILYRPKYDGVTKNEKGAETLYYAILPVVPSAGKPDREAAFEESWKALTDSLKVTWPNRTLVHRFYLPSGAVCYVAMAGYRANETLSGYGDCDGARMTLCLLDFGSYYVPVAQVYSWTTGKDNLNYLQGHFDAFIPTVRVAGATAPRPFATRQQVVGDWSHTDGYYSSTDYVFRSNGGYAGNVTNSSSSRHSLKLRADGTCRYDFFWLYNGVVRTDVWDGTWTYDKGRITLKNPKTGKTDEYSLLYNGKHPKTGERFLVLQRGHSRDNPVTPMNAHSTDSKLYASFKPKE